MSKVVTGKVRLSYVNIMAPRTDQNGNSKFSVTVLLPKSDLQTKAAIDAAIAQSIEEGRASKWNGLVPPNVPTPIHDGDGVKQDGSTYGDECKGHWVFTASTNADAGRPRPGVVDINSQPILDASQIYSGMYGRVSVNFAPYYHKQAGKKGIGCYLNHVQKLEDGEPLGASKASAEDDFGAVPMPAAPQHNQTVQPQYQAQYSQSMPPQYQMPQGQYHPPVYQAPMQPQYGQPMAQPQIDPFTGLPMNGGVMGL